MQNWEQCLSQAGCRITEPRRVVMRILLEAEAPLSPQEVHARGEAVHARLGLVTVYRALTLFEDLGLVRRVHREDGCHGYISASPGHQHALICQQCGHAIEFAGEDDLQELIERVEGRTGYRVSEHLLQLFGTCPKCQEKGELRMMNCEW